MAQSNHDEIDVANVLIDFAHGQRASAIARPGVMSPASNHTAQLGPLAVRKRERETSHEVESVRKRIRGEADEQGQSEDRQAEEAADHDNNTEGNDVAPVLPGVTFHVVWNKQSNDANEITSTLDRSYPRRIEFDWQHDYRMHALRREAIEKSASFLMLERLCEQPDIVILLTTQYLQPKDLLTLYTLSKVFHYQVNSRYTSYMLCSARRWAGLLPNKFLREVPPDEGILWGTVSAYDTKNEVHKQGSARNQNQRQDSTQHIPPNVEEHREKRFAASIPILDPMAPTVPAELNVWDITTLLPFNQYVHLCTIDPTLRRLDTAPSQTASQPAATTTPARIRHIPSFRYLFFLVFRARTVQTIMTVLMQLGHPLPVTATPVLVKLWFLLDLPTTHLRAALLKNTKYFTNHDLQILVTFFIKLDMVFSDPLDGDTFGPAGTGALRQCILAQRSLSTLAGVLTRKTMKTTIDMLKLKVRWNYTPRPQHRGMSILGVPANAVGAMRWEYWTSPWMMLRPERARPLMGIEEAVLREGTRRGVGLEKLFGKALLYGY
jgi:hypothetical protein